MRILTLNLLAVALLLFGATSASAFAINMTARGSTSGLVTNDTVTVDVFLNAEPDLKLLGVNVIASSDSALNYSNALSEAAVAFGGAAGGAQPSYILYTGGKGATILYPQQTPSFNNWPFPPTGAEQVNINYAENALGGAAASGTGIWLATMVFQVATGGLTSESISLSVEAGGGIVETFLGGIVPASDVGLSAPILLTGASVPEPTTAMLIGLGIVGLAAAGRRRA